MAEKSSVEGNSISVEEFLKKMEEDGYREKIIEWWFDDTLYHENDSGQIETELKKYYAFIQIFYHDNFRKSSTEIDQYIKALIKKVESEKKYTTDGEKDKKLRTLVLGSAYRRLGQFKTERYQTAEAEHSKAIYYLEKDTSFFELTDSEDTAVDDEDFAIMLLFLLNKAKYFRDIAEKDASRVDSSYWRAIMLFQEIKRKIEERYAKCQETPIEGILVRIYVSAWLNIAQVSRFQQKYDLTARECVELVGFCIRSVENEEKKNKIRKIVCKLPEMQNMQRKYSFSVKKFSSGKRNADHLFEDYILQALLQLGISYRDRVDFNGSREGNFCVRQAIGVFLVLGIVDCFKDSGTNSNPEKIENLLDTLQKLDINSLNVPQDLVVQIREACINDSALKNADAQNNLAVCLKKLDYCTDAIAILQDNVLKGNRFAEYNEYKSYLESGLLEDMKTIHNYCYKKNPESAVNEDPKNPENTVNGDSKKTKDTKPVYIYPEEPEKSNHKWLFLYARYLFEQKKYEEAEKMFSHIRNSRFMRWDSLELKAAYLEAQCQIKREKYLSAISSLGNIKESLWKLDNEKSRKRHEIRTEIDLGWCLIVEDRYNEALVVYNDLLTYLVQDEDEQMPDNNNDEKKQLPKEEQISEPALENVLKKLKKNIALVQEPAGGMGKPYNMKWHTVNRLSQERILHNLYDCWTYLHMNERGNIPDLISEICDSINESDVYIRYLDSLREMNQIKSRTIRDDIHNKWKNLSNTFGEILKDRPSDTITYSCWVIGKINYCMGLSRQDPEFEAQKKQLLLGLVSSTTPITMKCYIEVAQIILNENRKDRFLDISKDTKQEDGMELERSFLELFCHVNLLANGTNQAFMNLMTNQNFHSIELVARAELLAGIVKLYGNILQMKTQLRVTYDDLKIFACREQEGSANKDTKSIICQYTKLSTLKGILPKAAKGMAGEDAEKEPRFRMSNAARMNDASEGVMFRKICEKICEKIHSTDNTEKKEVKYEEIVQKYIDNSSGYKNTDEISSYDSDVYIASFSMNKNNFGLWNNYADKEKGCIVGFDQSFFDLVDKNNYSILDDEAEENALYRILYVDEQELLENGNNLGIKTGIGQKDKQKDKQNGEPDNTQDNKQEDKDDVQTKDINTIRKCIPNILQKLSDIEDMLQKNDKLIPPAAAGVVRAFIVDRLNEIRFLFKSKSYEYEEEMRMLRCSQNPEVDMNDSCNIPWLYINVEKKIDNLTLILGSKLDLQQVRELSVWAKSTGRVKQVIWSRLNRL